MSWFRRKTVEKSPAADSLLFRIGDFRQITPEDRKLNRLWMYDREGNFLFRVIDEIGEKEWKKYSPELYRISTDEFSIEYQCDELTHPDIEGMLAGEFILYARLQPGAEGFMDFIRNGGIDELDRGNVLRDDQLRHFIQELVTSPSFDDLNRSSALDAAGTAVHSFLPPWMELSRVEVVSVSEKLTEAQEKINAYNRWVSDNEAELQKKRQQLEFDVQLADIERARVDIANAREVAELEHQHQLELAKIRYELEKETLRESSREEIENKRKIAELKIKDLEDQQKKRGQIAENNRMIRDAALARINMQTAKEQQLLDLEIERAELEKQKLEQEIEYRKAIQQAEIDAINGVRSSAASGDLLQMLLKLISELNVKSQNNKEKIENLLAQDGPAASGTVPVYAEAAQRLTSKIMAQNYSHPMMLDKFGLISQTRSLALGRGDDAHAVTVSGNYNSIRIGQRMQLTMKAAKSGYLTLLCWGSDGMVTVLSPNFADDHVLLREGMDYRFPDNSVLAQYGIKQAGPTGRDRVLSLITPEPLLIASDIHDLVNLETDQIEKLCNDLMQLPADSWCAGYCTYLVEKEQD